MKPYDVALVPCTKSKHVGGLTPLTLYKGGPFSLMMRHAQQRASCVFIVSAKYGLLNPREPVQHYEAYVPTLTPIQRQALVQRMRWQLDAVDALWGHVISYLPRAYHEVLSEADADFADACARPYKHLPMLTLFKVLSVEIKDYDQKNTTRR